MATYQEQLAKLAAERERREKGDRAFNAMAGALADALMPLIEAGEITHDQASKVMVAIVRGVVDAKLKGRL